MKLIIPVERSSEMITKLIVTANQIEVFHNYNCNWNSSLLVVGNKNFCFQCGELTEKIQKKFILSDKVIGQYMHSMGSIWIKKSSNRRI